MRIFLGLVVVMCFSLSTLVGQGWVDIGIKGGAGLSVMYNDNLWNDRGVDVKFKGGNTYGGKIGINFNNNRAITIDFMSSKIQQAYTFRTPSGNFTINSAYKSFDIPLLYRYNSDYGSYMEVGGQMSMIKSLTETGRPTPYPSLDGMMVEKYYAAVFGFGSYVVGTNNLYLTMGFRMTYGFNDLIDQDGGFNQANYYPFLGSYTPDFPYESYKATNPFTFNFIMELNYDLGYIAKSNCNREAIIFF